VGRRGWPQQGLAHPAARRSADRPAAPPGAHPDVQLLHPQAQHAADRGADAARHEVAAGVGYVAKLAARLHHGHRLLRCERAHQSWLMFRVRDAPRPPRQPPRHGRCRTETPTCSGHEKRRPIVAIGAGGGGWLLGNLNGARSLWGGHARGASCFARAADRRGGSTGPGMATRLLPTAACRRVDRPADDREVRRGRRKVASPRRQCWERIPMRPGGGAGPGLGVLVHLHHGITTSTINPPPHHPTIISYDSARAPAAGAAASTRLRPQPRLRPSSSSPLVAHQREQRAGGGPPRWTEPQRLVLALPTAAGRPPGQRSLPAAAAPRRSVQQRLPGR
jgi:hypothetical protein